MCDSVWIGSLAVVCEEQVAQALTYVQGAAKVSRPEPRARLKKVVLNQPSAQSRRIRKPILKLVIQIPAAVDKRLHESELSRRRKPATGLALDWRGE
jgi:hypothetical protein